MRSLICRNPVESRSYRVECGGWVDGDQLGFWISSLTIVTDPYDFYIDFFHEIEGVSYFRNEWIYLSN